jgi:hypothetical protein
MTITLIRKKLWKANLSELNKRKNTAGGVIKKRRQFFSGDERRNHYE